MSPTLHLPMMVMVSRFYRRLAEIGPSITNPGGILVMELGWEGATGAQAVFANGWDTKIIDDLSGIPRVLVARRQ